MQIFGFLTRLLGFTDRLSMSPDKRAKIDELEASQAIPVAEERGKIVHSESQGSWLQKNWRPISMLVFLLLIILDVFGLLPKPLPPQAWDLMSLGFIGYVSGRSLEKLFRG